MDNPFLKVLQQQAQNNPMAGGGMPQAGGDQTGQPVQPDAGGMDAGAAGGATAPMPDSSQPGQTADSTKPLLQAMTALHGFIAQSTDKQDIAVVRSLMTLLGKVIQRDQLKASQMDQQSAQGPMGAMGGGLGSLMGGGQPGATSGAMPSGGAASALAQLGGQQ